MTARICRGCNPWPRSSNRKNRTAAAPRPGPGTSPVTPPRRPVGCPWTWQVMDISKLDDALLAGGLRASDDSRGKCDPCDARLAESGHREPTLQTSHDRRPGARQLWIAGLRQPRPLQRQHCCEGANPTIKNSNDSAGILSRHFVLLVWRPQIATRASAPLRKRTRIQTEGDAHGIIAGLEGEDFS